MNEFVKATNIYNWLETKLVNGDNGIVLEDCPYSSFDIIQDFIENCDCPFKTPVIYYRAFPEESTFQFINTVGDELAAKLGNPQKNQTKSLLNIIEAAELKMIVIDDFHLHPEDTLEHLLSLFANCQVAVILVGDRNKIVNSQLTQHLQISRWDKFEVNPSKNQVMSNE